MNPNYTAKTVSEWMEDIVTGELALTDFQRSQVWDPARTARFLKAVLLDQPTGTVLLVESGSGFGSRPVLNNDADISNAKSLILDGQQRLTSLWQGLMGKGEKHFYIRVKDLKSLDFEVKGVEHRSKEYRGYRRSLEEFNDDVIPVRIFYDPPDHDARTPTRLEKWCEEVIPEDSQESSQLRRSIEQRFKAPLDRYKLWYARFEQIGVDEAVTIFIETNRSSVKVTAFDLAVAQAVQIRADIKLRERIRLLYERHDRIKYYFESDRERWIPGVGEYILKIGCLKVEDDGLPPKNGNFEKALGYLFAGGTANADAVESNLVSALQFLEDNGVPNAEVLPRVPPVYVVAALQDELDRVPHGRRTTAIGLVTNYLWRSFLSDRYEVQANDRLYEDFKFLRRDIQRIKEGEDTREDAPVFRSEVSDTMLHDPIKSGSPVGNAIIALSLGNHSVDWMTGEEMNPDRVRKLNREGKLDRHHVFTQKSLDRGGLAKDCINHALNIVLIHKLTNIAFGSKEPVEYLKKLGGRGSQLTNEELKRRVESHLLSYDSVTRSGKSIKIRYEEYLRSRADLLWKEIRKKIHS